MAAGMLREHAWRTFLPHLLIQDAISVANAYFRQLSDTLLSILATRAGQMVKSIFGKSGDWDGIDALGYEELRN